jgi:hypothetical protein
MTESGPHGLLVALMEPDQSMEEEFNDWYDLEHTPQMSSVAGILSASRWMCVEGWPRYMAAYDLEHVNVLGSESYRGATGGHFTPWSRRILKRVRGWRRIALAGTDAAAGLTSPEAGALDFLQLADVDAARALAEQLGHLPGVIQTRVFDIPDEGLAAVVVEAGALADLPRELPAADARPLLSGSARYVRHWRRDPFKAFRAIDAGEVH